MFGLELETFDRDAVRPDDPFVQSYLAMQRRIGLLGFWLPWVLIAIDWLLIDDLRVIRGSMSAYYHSSARDVFVGGLFVTGAFLISYLSAKRRTYDYWLSTVAGWALIVVALVPTGRALKTPGFGVDADSCTRFPGPPGCSGVQEFLHENTARLVHGIAATAFVVLLAALCFVFAARESRYGPARAKRVRLYVAMGVLILLAGLWAKFGVALSLPFRELRLGATYVGEVVAFLAFGIAWLASGKDLKRGKLTDRIGEILRERGIMRSSVP